MLKRVNQYDKVKGHLIGPYARDVAENPESELALDPTLGFNVRLDSYRVTHIWANSS